uniref:Uncharacterized protein n=1 Tax=Hemiselmis andersenii TaxID=464988 RepID=A0A7S1DND0_HEMAN|mmetsp:Transcript_2146/g.4995  ORF Transcript_2146/g.4995 Transcript_2146/m.4995 type:complete len:124 (+) Transcript_2146:43-414(+)
MLQDKIVREAAAQNRDMDEGDESDPKPEAEIPEELLNAEFEPGSKEELERNRKIEQIMEVNKRAVFQWEKKQQAKARDEEREEERRELEEKRFYERHAKHEMDFNAKIHKAVVRYPIPVAISV